ncbi:hypothetical protein [Pectinatus haikarae]|uniref:Uncharacterized protein n=1 Tax=Pectinatus haikarae TaxID=349096 RepID=A0ABT9Y8P6_9FIRM|nr:hypothetical protein [Pectinatus haikarae]MDQ0203865.1 hypothetical protein [Pectinatus haikarae]
MNFKLMKIVFVFFLLFGIFTGRTMAQELIKAAVSDIDPAAKQLYQSALMNMDAQNADYDMQLMINMPMGNLVAAGDFQYQKSPLLMKNIIKAQFFTMEKQQFPIFSMTQYVQAADEQLLIYSSDGQPEKKEKWYLQRYPLADSLKRNIFLLPTGEQYAKQVQDIVDAVKIIHAENENAGIQRLNIAFDSKKLFDNKRHVSFSDIDTSLSPEDKKGMANILNDLFMVLQNSSDVSGTVDIDVNTHKIVRTELDLTDQIRIVAKAAYTAMAAEEEKAGGSEEQTTAAVDKPGINIIKDNAAVQDVIDHSTARVIIKVKPIDNVMKLALPQEVRDSAKEMKPLKKI